MFCVNFGCDFCEEALCIKFRFNDEMLDAYLILDDFTSRACFQQTYYIAPLFILYIYIENHIFTKKKLTKIYII